MLNFSDFHAAIQGQKEGGNDHQAGHHCPQRYRAQVGVTGWRQTQTSPFQTAVPPGLGHQGRNVTHTPPTSPMCTCLPASPTGAKIGTTHPFPKASFVGGNTPNKPNPKALLEGVTNNIKPENIAQRFTLTQSFSHRCMQKSKLPTSSVLYEVMSNYRAILHNRRHAREVQF